MRIGTHRHPVCGVGCELHVHRVVRTVHVRESMKTATRNENMGTVRQALAFGACGLMLSACSFSIGTLVPGSSSRSLQLQSEPAGALAQTSLGQSCQTPCELEVAAQGDFTVTFTLGGFASQTVPVKLKPKEAIFDASAGFSPNPIVVQLETTPPAPKQKPKTGRPHVARPAPPALGPPPPSQPEARAPRTPTSELPPPPQSR
jgi:hypothetical protein